MDSLSVKYFHSFGSSNEAGGDESYMEYTQHSFNIDEAKQ